MTATTKEACKAWNEAHPVGVEVVVTLDSGREVVTRTRSGACIVGDTPSVWLEDIRGCYALDRVKPLADVLAETTGRVAL